MNKDEAIAFYKKFKDKCNAFELANTTIMFDSSTIAPKKGSDYRIKMAAILSGEEFDYICDPANLNKLYELSTMDLGSEMNEEIRQYMKKVENYVKLPRDFFIQWEELRGKASVVWEEAKHKNDWHLFKDILKELIEMSKKRVSYFDLPATPYDFMLDEYEEGMNIQRYDEFFHLIKTKLLPFIKQVQSAKKQINDKILHQYYAPKDQEKVMDLLKEYMNYDKSVCYMGVSEHPFTSDFSMKDVRITTKYLENSLVSSIFSIIHEYGHALYMLQVNEKYEGLEIGKNMSSGMHESQSRLLENYIGRRRSFWVNNFEEVKKIFPEQLKDVSLDTFMEMVNCSQASLIRTEADELTYPIHILIRYELEKQFINDTIDYEHLDEIWADKYEEYLGVRPTQVSEGILQDIHWSDASFGYFPTYALGSAYAAQFFAAMKRDIDVDAALSQNDFGQIAQWLKENIHQYGSYLNADQILQKVCHESFDPNYYIDYLIEKYSKLYEL